MKTGSAVCIPTPIQATERGLLKVQNPKLAPRSDPTPLHPLGPAPGQYLQVCEIIQALIWSEHVQQPNHLGRRPEHQVGWGLPPPQAGTVLQAGKPPAAVPMSLPCPQGQLCPLAAPPSPGTPAHRHRLFLDGDSWGPGGRGGPKSGSAPSHPRSSSSLALPPPLPFPIENLRPGWGRPPRGANIRQILPRQAAPGPSRQSEPALPTRSGVTASRQVM